MHLPEKVALREQDRVALCWVEYPLLSSHSENPTTPRLISNTLVTAGVAADPAANSGSNDKARFHRGERNAQRRSLLPPANRPCRRWPGSSRTCVPMPANFKCWRKTGFLPGLAKACAWTPCPISNGVGHRSAMTRRQPVEEAFFGSFTTSRKGSP